MKKSKDVITATPPHLMPIGKKLSPEMQRHLEKGRAAMKDKIKKQREKEKALEQSIIGKKRKAS